MMDDQARDILVPLLEFQEQNRRLPYDDATGRTLHPGDTLKGFLSIGIGRNLNAKGLASDEINLCLCNDMRDAETDGIFLLGLDIYSRLSPNRKASFLSMVFNMGRAKMLGFHQFLQAIKFGDYRKAKTEMLSSLWARQVGLRANTLADMMERG